MLPIFAVSRVYGGGNARAMLTSRPFARPSGKRQSEGISKAARNAARQRPARSTGTESMKTGVCEMFGIEVPIFAFSHCRDVVVEVSKAGGMGVLGVGYYTAEQLEIELKWIDDHIGGLPYGVDLLM